MRPVNRGPVPTTTTRSGKIIEQNSEKYSMYRYALIKRIGEYCSFCEVPLGANLAIEHMISKSHSPELETDWENFVLACTNCNSTKGSKVTRDNFRNYYWPTKVYGNQTTFNLFSYGINSDQNAIVAPSNPGDQLAIDTIDLLALNRVRTNDPKVSDRRVWNRTRTWNMAEGLADRLLAYYNHFGANADNDPAVRLLKKQIKAAAVASGFWSVWMTLFKNRTFYNTDTTNQLLCDLFIASFPGTNYPLGTCVAPTFN